MSEKPQWEHFNPFIREVVLSSLREKKAKVLAEFAMNNAQIAGMMAGMVEGAGVDIEGFPDAIAGMIGGQQVGNQGAHAAILAAFDAAIAKLEA